ncbi:membrane protein [Erwinia typographi]|uniref:Membrane protein n=1 Tax=Erwinia typographi TaxID=371042 RepID=A0A0A4ABZ2_9GAMM|nr:OmpA family protein [Erwinia typographi]KGT95338.1 membrane protein [Erwinia typographi]
MTLVLQRLLALWIGLLTAGLCLLFLPVARSSGVLLLLAVTLIIGVMIFKLPRRRAKAASQLWSDLPDAAFRQPVVLCCGESGLSDEEPVRILPQGCFILVSDSSELQHNVRQLLLMRPDWGRQISLCLSISPHHQHDNAALENDLFALRWQIALLRRETRQALPLLLNVGIAGEMTQCTEPLWQVQLAGNNPQIWLDDTSPRGVSEWLQSGGATAMQQQILLNTLDAWTHQQVLRVLTEAHTDVASVTPGAIMLLLQSGISGSGNDSLWRAWLLQHTAISSVGVVADTPAILPEFILPLLPQGRGLTPRTRALRAALNAFAIAVVIALCVAAWNNQSLIRRIAFDLEHYYRIAMTDYAPKLAAVNVLREDAKQLDGYARQGAPLRLGLGLYQGGHLHLPVLRAVSTWIPEARPKFAPKPKTQPTLVRLDAMSLFDSGKSDLKNGSTKVLINALVNVKARAGWLIVVAGHTDDTGNLALNQRLSLKRAEAVRDWLRDTGDVDESCFAVQGFGQSRPMVTNNTAEGRAANRRVEISLVPQVDACRASGAIPSLSQDGDGNHEEKE